MTQARRTLVDPTHAAVDSKQDPTVGSGIEDWMSRVGHRDIEDWMSRVGHLDTYLS